MEMNHEENMTTNGIQKRQSNLPKMPEIKVDASTLTNLAVVALLLPLLIVSFLG